MLTKRLLAAAVAAALCFFALKPCDENILRLHVIANSDGAADQAAKFAVRDAILGYEADMATCSDGAQAKAMLMEDGEALLELIEAKRAGRKPPKAARAGKPSNVVNLFDALKKSLAADNDEEAKPVKATRASKKKAPESKGKRKSA